MKIEHFVLGGERVPAADGKSFAVIEPGSGQSFAEVAEAGLEDVERAVQRAYWAFEQGRWARLSATDRGRILLQAATLVRERLEDIAVIEARCWPRNHAARTCRRMRPDHPVELSSRDCILEDCARPGMR